MAWDDKPPTTAELKTAASEAAAAPISHMAWDALPPHPVEQDMITKLANKLRDTGTNLGQSVGDTTLGTVQGATMGFADELQGAGQAGLNAIQQGTSINPLDPAFLAKYREFQQAAAKPYKEAEKRSPVLYGLGNVAGGVAVAPAFGAAGLATSGGRAAVGAALREGGALAAAKQVGIEGIKDAVTGLPAGALYGAGMSEGGVDTPEGRAKLLHDTEFGAATGGIVNGAIGMASSAVPTIAETSAKQLGSMIDNFDSPFSRLVKKAYNYGKEGVNLSNEETRGEFFNKPYEFSEDLMSKLEKADKMYGEKIGDTITNAEKAGATVNIDSDLNAAASKIDAFVNESRNIELDNKSKDIIGRLLTQNSQISPSEAQYLKKQLAIVADKASRPNTNVPYPVVDALHDVQQGLNSAMKDSIPGYGDAAKNFAQFRQNTVEQILSGQQSPDITNIKFGNINDADRKLQNKIAQMVQGASVEGSGTGQAQGSFQILKQKLIDLQKTNPEAFAAMGQDAKNIVGGIRNAADDSALIQGISKQHPNEGTATTLKKGLLEAAGASGKSGLLGIANKAGLYAPGVGTKIVNAAGAPLRLTRKALFELPLESTKAIANHLSTSDSPAIKNMGEALAKAAANEDQVGKNAVLFSILQNPNTRKMLNLEDDNK